MYDPTHNKSSNIYKIASRNSKSSEKALLPYWDSKVFAIAKKN